MPAAFRPAGNAASYVFGIDSLANPRMPYNRADYYLTPSNDPIVPTKCAPGTGVLVKRVLRQDNGNQGKELPLLDCVVTFQVALGVDSSYGDGSPQKNCLTNEFSNVTIAGVPSFANYSPPTDGFYPADLVRTAVKEVRIYALAQEGTFDMDYNFIGFSSGTSILVGESSPSTCDAVGGTGTQSCDCGTGTLDDTLGILFDMDTLPTRSGGVDNYRKYRWRVYRMAVKPESIVSLEQ
jgi:hypothetical protein